MLQSGQMIKNGKYQLQMLLGRGAQGEVWAAQQTGIGFFAKNVVLKFVALNGSERKSMQKMLLREANLCAELAHPSIVSILDADEEDGQVFIAMERIHGIDLDQLEIRHQEANRGPIPWDLVCYMMIRACRGLHYAHTKKGADGKPLKIIHRDLKPHNMLLSEQGEIKIIDFGIAKAEQSLRKTKTDSIRGTPAYMSPEQIGAQPIDARADLFSLGVVLYQLCSGILPFDAEQIYTMLFKIVQSEPQPLIKVAPHVPIMLNDVVMRLLEKDPDDRFASAKALQRALEDILETHQKYVTEDQLADFYADMSDEFEDKAGTETNAKTHTETPPSPDLTSHFNGLEKTDLAQPPNPPLPTPVPSSLKAMLYTPNHLESSNVPDETASYENKIENSRTVVETGPLPQPPSHKSSPNKNLSFLLAFLIALLGASILGIVLTKNKKGAENPQTKHTKVAARKSSSKKGPNRRAKMMEGKSPNKQTQKMGKQHKKRPHPNQTKSSKRVKPPQKRRLLVPRATPRSVARSKHERIIKKHRKTGTLHIHTTLKLQLFEEQKKGRHLLGTRTAWVLTRRAGRHCFIGIARERRLSHSFCVKLRRGQTRHVRKHFAFGTLSITAKKKGLLFLAPFGQIGETGKVIQLPAGKHKLQVIQADDPLIHKTITVRIRAHKTRRIKAFRFR